MATVLDYTTILAAMRGLSEKLGFAEWFGVTPRQKALVQLLAKHYAKLAELVGLETLASYDYQELNQLLEKNGFKPTIEPFDPEDGVGVVSILDLTETWVKPGEFTWIQTIAGQKPGFELSEGAFVYDVPQGHLLRLVTIEGDTVWILVPGGDDYDADQFEVNELAFGVMAEFDTYEPNWSYSGVRLPMAEFAADPDVKWLIGMQVGSKTIVDAHQQVKVRMNENGLRAKVATDMTGLEFCVMQTNPPFEVNKPFYMWITQEGFTDLPMIPMHIGFDDMRKPEGSLEDL